MVEPQGGIFGPVPGKLARPVYTWGPKDSNGVRTTHLYQCPVSAIPAVVFELLDLWFDCRLLRVLPTMTPLVRSAFAAFELEMQAVESRRGANQASNAAALAVGAMTKIMGGSR